MWNGNGSLESKNPPSNLGWRYVWRSSSNHGLFWQNTSLERRRYVCLKGTFRCSTDYFGYNNFFLFKSVIFFTNSTVSSSKLKIELFCVKICKFQFCTAFALCRPREYSLRIWQWCINVCSMNWIMNVQIFKFCSTTSVESLGDDDALPPVLYYILQTF